MQLTDVLKSLRRHWKFSLGVLLLAVVVCAAFLYTRKTVRPADRYRASVDVLIPAIDSKGIRPPDVPGTLLQGQSQLALGAETEQRALDGANVPPNKRSEISFGFVETSGSSNTAGSTGCTGTACSDVVSLSVTANNPTIAVSVAQEFARSYTAARRAAVQHGAVASQQNQATALQVLKNALTNIDATIAQKDRAVVSHLLTAPSQSASVAVGALPPGTPEDVILLVVQHNALLGQIQSVREGYATQYIGSLLPSAFADTLQIHNAVKVTPPPPSSKVPVAAILGVALALALLIPLLRDRLDRSIRSARVAADVMDATVLTVLPPTTRRMTHALAPPGSDVEEAYRSLAATAVATDRLPRAIVVTSPTGTLQDMVAANFAAALANLGLRVALVATDSRQSWFTNGHPPEGNLSFKDLMQLAHKGQLNGALSRGLVRTDVENLYVLPPGGTNGDVGLDGLRPLLEALSSSGVDVIVIAGPSLLDEPDATIFAWTTRSVLWTVEEGRTTEAEAKEAAARLELAGASPFGIVMVSARQT